MSLLYPYFILSEPSFILCKWERAENISTLLSGLKETAHELSNYSLSVTTIAAPVKAILYAACSNRARGTC